MFHVKQSPISAPEKCLLCDNKELTKHLELKDYFLTEETFHIYHCPACSIMFTWPKPESHELPAYYRSKDYISHSNKKSDLQSRVYQFIRNYTLRQKIRLIRRFTKGNMILDIGCATGEFLNQCKKRGYTTTGVEPDEQARGYAAGVHGLNVTEPGELNNIPPLTFDVITLWHVLEHVEDPDERMEQIYRLLKPGGYVFIALPNRASNDASHYGKYWAAWDVPRHLFHYDRNSLKFLAEKHQFEISDIRPMLFDSYYISLLSEKYMNNSLCFIRAAYRGFVSNFMAGMGNNEYSSLIYILRKPGAKIKAADAV